MLFITALTIQMDCQFYVICDAGDKITTLLLEQSPNNLLVY